MVQSIVITRLIKYDFDVKKSLFFEEFSYITSFTADGYSQHDPPRLFDLSTMGQIHNVAGRGLITGWPSTQQGGDNEEIANTCVCLENSLLVDSETNNSDPVATTGEMWEV